MLTVPARSTAGLAARRYALTLGLLGLGLLSTISSCDGRRRIGGQVVGGFIEAVQSEDVERLFCLMAGAAESDEFGADLEERRRNFAAWASAGLRAYEQGRDAGRVELDGHGIALVKLFSLGRGTFFSLDSIRSAADGGIVLEMRLTFGYGQIDLSRFTPGTTFYISGVPVGRVHPVQVPAGSAEIAVDALNSVRVRWSLVRAAANAACPERWTVAAVENVEGSEEVSEITWIF